MGHHKISESSNYSTVSKFLIKKWIEVNDLLRNQYSVNKNIRFETIMLRSNLRDYSDAYIIVKGVTIVEDTNDSNRTKKKSKFQEYSSI